MMGHSRRWHREIYSSDPWWVYAICDERNDVFNSPLCGYRVAGNSFQTQQIRPSPHDCAKRTLEPSREENSKSARTSLENRHAVPYSSIDSSSSSSAADEVLELCTAPAHTEITDMVARHVAAHLQAVMLLTIRLALIQVEDEDTLEEVRRDLCDTEGSERLPIDLLTVEMSDVSILHSVDGDVCTDSEPPMEGATAMRHCL
ncbi:hypothetical protein RU639_003664 [Aspergillus parasiticus]